MVMIIWSLATPMTKVASATKQIARGASKMAREDKICGICLFLLVGGFAFSLYKFSNTSSLPMTSQLIKTQWQYDSFRVSKIDIDGKTYIVFQTYGDGIYAIKDEPVPLLAAKKSETNK